LVADCRSTYRNRWLYLTSSRELDASRTATYLSGVANRTVPWGKATPPFSLVFAGHQVAVFALLLFLLHRSGPFDLQRCVHRIRLGKDTTALLGLPRQVLRVELPPVRGVTLANQELRPAASAVARTKQRGEQPGITALNGPFEFLRHRVGPTIPVTLVWV
jgi:hypothetical protein